MASKSSPVPKAHADGIPVWCSHDEIVDIVKLIPNPKNPNHHPEKQIDLGARVIKAHGWRWPIVVSKRSGFITKGHGRLLFAERMGVKEAPVDYQDYATEAEEWQDVIADNRLQEFAEPDLDGIAEILESIDDIYAGLTGYDLDELLKEIGSVDIPDDDEFYEDSDAIETDIKMGEIFKLGRHRLMCGDATNDLHINQLLGEDEPEFLFTDPPYEFNLAELFNVIPHININHYLLMLGFKQMIDWVKYDGLVPHFDLVYVRKNITSPVGNNKVPHYKHVQLIYSTRGDAKTIFDKRGARGAFSDKALYPTVIEEEDHVGKQVFGYGKDLGAICKIISGFNFKSMLDLFAGSGTFLIACEKMGRTCYAMELNPKSCQIIIDRWNQSSEEKAEKILNA